MKHDFNGKAVLVTGGTTGIGRAAALAFAQAGARVYITGRTLSKWEDMKKAAEALKLNIEFLNADASSSERMKEVVDTILEKSGRLDIAFNNAGIDGEAGRTADCTDENWNNVMNINLNGVFYCMKHEIRAMLKAGSGNIINNISVSGHKGYPGGIAYVTSKHAVAGLTKAAAMEYAKQGIRVNGISPGLIRTPMTDKDRAAKEGYDEWVRRVEPMGRIGEAEEVADVVLWLASGSSSFVTGHIVAVDGGILAC